MIQMGSPDPSLLLLISEISTFFFRKREQDYDKALDSGDFKALHSGLDSVARIVKSIR